MSGMLNASRYPIIFNANYYDAEYLHAVLTQLFYLLLLIAASMNPLNNGCGLLGLDLSSG